MIQVASQLTEFLQYQNSARLSYCWTIERTDGVTLRLTDHDHPLVLADGYTYGPVGSFSTSARERKEGLNDNNMNLLGVLESDLITHEDLRAGKYRDAKITEQLVDWQYPWAGTLATQVYWIYNVKYNGQVWEAQLRGLSQWLRRPAGYVHTRVCHWRLADSHCRVIPEIDNGAVTAVIKDRWSFTTNLAGDLTTDWFALGLLEWTTVGSPNLGFKLDIKKNVLNSFYLSLPCPFPIQVGDTFAATVGCDGNRLTCINKFNNILNFRGFPWMPGNNALLKRK